MPCHQCLTHRDRERVDMKQALILIGLLGIGFVATGCRSELETGYEPRLLNASNAQQRAYYAMPYTPAQMDAMRADREAYEAHRPTSPLR